MENELMSSKDYYILSIDIYKTLALSKEHRPVPAKEYLDKKYSDYVKLFENSNLLSRRIIDKLNPLPLDIPFLEKMELKNFNSPNPSCSSNSPFLEKMELKNDSLEVEVI
jgi:hypothetical protein